MAGSVLMSIGTRAMFAAYSHLNTISNNIANANTAGYSRQETVQTTAEGQFTGSGYFGRGVTVQTVQRANNIFLTQQAASTRSVAAADGVRRDLLLQLEQVFGSGSAGLGHAATQLFNAFGDLAAAPADLSARQAVMARAEDVTSMARAYSGQISMLQANVRSDVENSVSEVNSLAAQVAQLNFRIASALGTGHTPNDLFDARDQLIEQISEKVEVHTISASDGSTSVFIAGGQNLVLGGASNKLVVRRDDYDPSRVAIGISVAGNDTPLDASAIGSGTLAGLMAFQNDDLVEARNRLGQWAAVIGTVLNTQQSFGIDLAGSSGAPLFSLGAPVALANRSNAGAGSLNLAIVDAKALKASEYTLENDLVNGGYLVTRLSDGQVFNGVVSGDVIDGFSITNGPVAPGPGDRFLLQPSSAAAASMDMVMGNPRGIAAGAPVTASAAVGNTGTASLSALTVVAAPTAPYQAMTLRFTNATGGYDIVDAGNAVLTSGTWNAGTPIAYNGLEIQIQGQPAAGDEFIMAPTAFPGASNGNAVAFDSLASQVMVDGQTATDAYALVLSEFGVRVQGAVSSAETSGGAAARAAEALTGAVGVNLDEEAAKLIQYQQAYQAAAKMLQTAQSVLDTLLELGR